MTESKKPDTNFCAEFLKIVRKRYGEDFDFEICTIERGPEGDVVTFQVKYRATSPRTFVENDTPGYMKARGDESCRLNSD